jgi:DNA-binding CsgD family transcriptional regulator
VTVVVELVLGFALALVMHKALKAVRGWLRTAILVPYGIITVVSAFAWFYMFDINSGFVNTWFNWVPGISPDLNWFAGTWTSLAVIMASEIWKTTPFISLLLLAGLAQVPDELTEAVTSLHRGMRWLDRVAAQKLAAGYGQEPLTERETDVLRCLVTGAANKTVAKKLNIALGTVKVHVRSIMGKLDARTRTEAATVAIKRGLLCDACDTPAGPPIVSPISPVSGSSPMETIRAVMTMS